MPAKRKPYYEMRPANASTSVLKEMRARGASAAYALMMAKLAFKSRRVKTIDKLTRLIDAGIGNEEAVVSLYRQATKDGRNPHTAMGYVFGEWMMRSQKGQQLSELTRGWLTPDAEPLIKAGEDSSNVPKALQDYIFMSEKKKQVQKTVSSALKTPLMNLVLIIVYLWVVAYQMTPVYEQAVPRSAWTGSLNVIGVLGDLVKDDIFYVLGVLAALVAFVVWSMNKVLGKRRISMDRFPPWSIYRQLYGANFMLSFSALYGAGTKDVDIIKTLLRTANPYYAERLRAFLKFFEKGEKLGDALLLSGFQFPDRELVADFQIYQKLPDLALVLDKVSRSWTEDNIQNIKNATNLIAGLLTMVCFFIVAMMTSSNFEFVNLVQKYSSR